MQKNVLFHKKITIKEKLTYGMGDIASQFIYGSLSMYILFFWTDVAGIAAATAGNILLISKVWDGVNDPIMGWFIDRHEFSGQKARPYLKWFAIPFGISAVICFITPDASMTVKVIYAFLSYNITNMIFTAINIPYGILATKMTNDKQERGSLNVYRMLLAMCGVAFVSFVTPILVSKYSFFVAFLVLGIIATAIWLYVYKNTFELPKDELLFEDGEKLSFSHGVSLLMRNKVWIILTFGMLFTNLASAVMGTTAIYYVTYFLKKPELIGIYLLLPVLGQILSLFLYTDRAFIHFGKIKTTQYTLVGAAILNLLIYMFVNGPNDSVLLGLLLFIQGMMIGPIMSATFAMLADSIEYGEWKTDERVEGFTYAGASLGIKIGAGIGTAMVGYILSFVGYVPNTEQSVNVLATIKIIYVCIPIIFYLAYALILRFNPTDQLYGELERDLTLRRTKEHTGS